MSEASLYLSELPGADSADKQEAGTAPGVQEKYPGEAPGTADAITAAFEPPIAHLWHGMTVQVRASAANLTAVPIFKAGEAGALSSLSTG